MSPRLRMIVRSCKTHDEVEHPIGSSEPCGDAYGETSARGCRPQDTRFRTPPFEPTIAVFTAPASIRTPTSTTKCLKTQLQVEWADKFNASPLMKLPKYWGRTAVRNDHGRKKMKRLL